MLSSLTPSIQKLQELEQNIPIISDKALIDLVNGIHVNRDVIQFRKNNGVFSYLLSLLSGNEQKRQSLVFENFLSGQIALTEWVTEITNSLNISQIALIKTQEKLIETKRLIFATEKNYQDLNNSLAHLNIYINERFISIDKRLQALEIAIAASESLDQIVGAWKAKKTYGNFPWLLQVYFLVLEVYSSPVVNYEIQTGNTSKFRDYLTNVILEKTQEQFTQPFFKYSDLLSNTVIEIGKEELILAALLLDIRRMNFNSLQNMPYVFSLGNALEIKTLSKSLQPKDVGATALELSRLNTDNQALKIVIDWEILIRNLIEELANQSLIILGSKKYE